MKLVHDEFMKEGNNIFEGYMFLHNRTLFRQWMFRPKYFILTPHYLYCFKRRGDLASIPRDVLPLQQLSVSIDEEIHGFRKHYYLKLESTVTKKAFNMFCFSFEERDEWLTKILHVIARNLVDGEFANRYLHTSYSSRSLSKLSGYNLMQSSELNKLTSLSCMELTNFGLSQDQRRQTLSHLTYATTSNNNNDRSRTNENVNSILVRTSSCTSAYRITSDNILLLNNDVKINKNNDVKSMKSSTEITSSNKPYITSQITASAVTSQQQCRRKSIKRHNSTTGSFLERISYLNNLNIRQSVMGNSIRSNFIERLKR